ncbi:hypothetical protein [Synechococcus phage S-H34]|uniref:DUF7936 domain-containing protein n=1 Tax=Synechococcus phage S-H34 TaxID=2718942 RepID=A0A6G8R6A2_9CAUD|nr:hypothetical protein PQC15_gp041 [Synechococcus phage S-H34]QIN96913.1 hypothetical protein [Synechococcus phage S-H34]
MKHVWTVTNLDYDTASGRVSHVHYLLETTDSHGHVARTYGTVKLTGDVSTPLETVTKGLALSWAKRAMGTECVALKEAQNEKQLHRDDSVGSGAPWA